MDVLFARTAASLLEQGDHVGAARLCTEGTAAFPWYATGHLLLGRAYDRLGLTHESLLAYRKALALLPDVPQLQEVVRDAEHHLDGAFNAFAQEQSERLKGTAGTMTLEQYLKEETEGKDPPPGISSRDRNPGIVTPTLAEIYASQGEFQEAIDAYRALAERRPEQETKFRERIKQLQKLAGKPGGEGTESK